MGYTHYFEHEKVSQDVWNRIVADCKKVFEGLPDVSTSAGAYYADDAIVLGDGWGEEPLQSWKVICSKGEIVFNGIGDLSHEGFHLSKDGSGGFRFCKTVRKPYDLFVCCCLIIYWYHSPHTIDLSSDGDMDDWKPAIELVSSVLGEHYGMKFIMEEVID